MSIHTGIQDIDIDKWQELVDNSLTATYFQTPDCYRFFCTLSFIEPFVFAVSENNRITGLAMGYVVAEGNFLKRILTKRAIIIGGMLMHQDISENAFKQLSDTVVNQLRNKAIYIELRNFHDFSIYKEWFKNAGFCYSPHLNFQVPTPDKETALKQLSTTKRRDIKLSVKSGAKWYQTKEMEDVKQFYGIVSNLYKTKVKTPLFPFGFFEKIVAEPACRFFVVKYEDQLIGGSVCMELADKTLYEWFICGLDGHIKNVYPSTLATWAAIEYAASNKTVCFDMMGAGKPDEGYGVRDFKAKFGGKLVENGRFLHINNPFLYKIGKLGVKLTRFSFSDLKKKKEKTDFTVERRIEKIDRRAWSDFVMNHPNGNIFQTPQFYDLYAANSPKFKPVILVVKNRKGVIVGSLMSVIQREYNTILGALTTRSIVFGGPLVDNNQPEIAGLILKNYNLFVRFKVIYSQLRNIFDLSALNSVFKKNGFHYEEHLDILLDLNRTVEELEQNLHRERKRNIAKAEKEGLVFKHLTSEEEVESLVDLLKKTYQRVKVPMSFEKVFHQSKQYLGTNVQFFGAYYQDKMIAGQIRLCYKDLVYAWFAGSDAEYLNKRPNDFLLWNVILWAKENGFKKFDFGGAGKPQVPYGVRDYKIKYGGEMVSYGRFVKIYNPFFMSIGKHSYKLYKKIVK